MPLIRCMPPSSYSNSPPATVRVLVGDHQTVRLGELEQARDEVRDLAYRRALLCLTRADQIPDYDLSRGNRDSGFAA